MKNAVIFFVSGLILGGVVVFSWKSGKGAGSGWEEGEDERATVRMVERRERERWRARIRHSGSGGEDGGGGLEVKDELIAFLKGLSRKSIGDADFNYLSSIRMAAEVASMDEAELLSLVEVLGQVEDPKLKELGEIVQALAYLRWFEVNGTAAMEFFLDPKNELPKGVDRDSFVGNGMLAWTEYDPEGARRWMEGQIREIDRRAAAGEDEEALGKEFEALATGNIHEVFLSAYTQAKGEKAREIYEGLEHPEIAEDMRSDVIEAMAREEESVEKLKALLLETRGGDFGAQLTIVEKLSKSARDDARRWVEQQPSSVERDHLVTQVAGEWLKEDPAAAADWYLRQELVEENREQDRLSRIFGAWRGKDLEGAYGWLESQPDTEARDQAESLAANSALGQKDYAQAVEWVGGIQNEAMREQAFGRILKNSRDRKTGELPAGLVEAATAAGFEVE
ncbi:MAG: hypothetical protein ACSHYF_06525 [Verrucomicrobiaceae bacterium]